MIRTVFKIVNNKMDLFRTYFNRMAICPRVQHNGT